MNRLVTQNRTSCLRRSDKVYISQCAKLKTSVGHVNGFFILCYPFLKGTVDLEREEGEECEENMEVCDDSSSSPSGTLRNYPLTCKVLYSYKVQTHTKLRHVYLYLRCPPLPF